MIRVKQGAEDVLSSQTFIERTDLVPQLPSQRATRKNLKDKRAQSVTPKGYDIAKGMLLKK